MREELSKEIFTENTALAALACSGQSIAQATFELMESAQKEIVWIEFLLRDDEFGIMKLALLRKKAREGKRAVLHVDSFHFMAHFALLRHLMDEGVEVTLFNELSLRHLPSVTSRNHNKALIIDSRLLKIGDSNTGNEYVHWGDGRKMKSIDIIIEGKVAEQAREYAAAIIKNPLVKVPEVRVAELIEVEKQRQRHARLTDAARAMFHSLFINMDSPEQITRPTCVLVTALEVQQAKEKLDVAERRYNQSYRTQAGLGPNATLIRDVKFFGDLPEQQSNVTKAIAAFIREASARLVIVSPYLILTPEIKKALSDALSRGVRARIYTNSLRSTDNMTTQLAYEYRIEEFAALGDLGIYEYEGDETLHAKFILRDDTEVMLMTYNLDWRSALHNLETAVQLSSPGLTRDLAGWVEAHKDKFTCAGAKGSVVKERLHSTSASDKMRRFIIGALEKQL